MRAWLTDRAPFLVGCLMLVVLLGVYSRLQRGVFTLEELNLDATASMTLLLAATGQTIVLLRGGIDLSIGGMISLGTVLAATRFGDDPITAAIWAFLIVLIGALVGIANGVLVTALRLQPFLVTLATWSILAGAALFVCRPMVGGFPPAGWRSAAPAISGCPPRSGCSWRCFCSGCGFATLGSAPRSSAPPDRTRNPPSSPVSHLRQRRQRTTLRRLRSPERALPDDADRSRLADGRQRLHPAHGGGGGDRRISLFGGRGGLAGALVGAFILTIIGNLVFVLDISSYWQPIASGVILLTAVLASSLAEKSARRSLA